MTAAAFRPGVYDLALRVDRRLRQRLMPALEGSHPMKIRVCEQLPDIWATRDRELREEAPLATGVTPWQQGQPTTVLQSTSTAQVLRLDHASADFFWSLSGNGDLPSELIVHLRRGARWEVVEIQLLGTVLALLMELQGRVALHASAVALQREHPAEGGENGEAVLFLAAHGGGKTTLALDFLRAGAQLLADDVSVIELDPAGAKVWPAFPQMRLWPGHAEDLLGDAAAELQRVLPWAPKLRVPVACEGLEGEAVGSLEPVARGGAFRRSPAPVRRLYLPQRVESGGAVRIEPMRGPEGLVELLRAAFVGGLLERLEDQRRREGRLDLAAGLLSRVPLKRLIFPSGLQHLPAVREAVKVDLASG